MVYSGYIDYLLVTWFDQRLKAKDNSVVSLVL